MFYHSLTFVTKRCEAEASRQAPLMLKHADGDTGMMQSRQGEVGEESREIEWLGVGSIHLGRQTASFKASQAQRRPLPLSYKLKFASFHCQGSNPHPHSLGLIFSDNRLSRVSPEELLSSICFWTHFLPAFAKVIPLCSGSTVDIFTAVLI